MAKFAVILPAAGKSTRFVSTQKKKKIFHDLHGRAVWLRAADHFVQREDVVQTLIVLSPEDVEYFKEKYAPNLAFMNIEIVLGGAERFESVRNALARVRPEVDYVAVHDAARPLLAIPWIDAVFQAAQETGAALLGVAVNQTLKRVDSRHQVVETVSREGLWQAQTPQVFRREILDKAYAQQGTGHPTDDAQLVEKLGHPVTMVPGSPLNIKITTAEDLDFAHAAWNALPKPSVFRPLHPFADESPFGKL